MEITSSYNSVTKLWLYIATCLLHGVLYYIAIMNEICAKSVCMVYCQMNDHSGQREKVADALDHYHRDTTPAWSLLSHPDCTIALPHCHYGGY